MKGSPQHFLQWIGMSLLISLSTFIIWQQWPDHYAHVIFCDVGQGDAILVTYKHSQLLIDGGPNDKVVDCLEKHLPFWDRQLELVIATHPDADHITGLNAVLDQYTIQEIWIEGRVNPSKTFQKLHDRIQSLVNNNTRVFLPSLGKTFSFDPVLHGSVIYPFRPVGEASLFTSSLTETQLSDIAQKQNQQLGETNDVSISLIITVGRVKLLFTGDLEERGELALITQGVLTDIDVLKAGHHGSKTSNLRNFLQITRPEAAVISVGKKNKYGHPHSQTLQNFSAINAKILRTDEHGTIELITNGSSYWWKLQKM